MRLKLSINCSDPCKRKKWFERIDLRLGFLWILLLFAWRTVLAGPVSLEEHHYQETTKDSAQAIHWQLREDGDFILTSTTPEEISVCRIDRDFYTMSWQVDRVSEQTALTARRVADTILLTGQLAGETITRKIKIDDAPWFQAGSFCLRALLNADADEISFWILRPGKFTAHKLKARKNGMEILPLDGVNVPTHVIKVSLTGLLAPLWSGTYWFRTADGVLLRYRSPSGPPGSPETLIKWVSAPLS